MKRLNLLLTLVIMCMITACQKDGPVTVDNIPPNLSLTISGGGFNKTFYSDVELADGQLNLMPDTKYTVNIGINDTGGISLLQLQLDKQLNIHSVIGLPTATETETILQKIYSIIGNTSSPYNSFVINANFTTPDVGVSEEVFFNIYSHGNDYTPNYVHVNLNCQVAQSPSGGYGWIPL